MQRKLFGTDGIRGVANHYPMTSEVALKLGRAIAHISKRGPHRHRILIGKDTRVSGYMLEYAIASGICSFGVDVMLTGPMPTPAIAFLTRTLRADAGIVISASHNPFQDNGIKFFGADGFKLADDIESEIEALLESGDVEAIRPTALNIGKTWKVGDAVGRYVQYVKMVFDSQLGLDGMKIVVDCANGAAYRVAPAILEELGAEVVAIFAQPDGKNINEGCGAVHPQRLQEEVLKHGAQLGIALDGDADRVIIVDEKGRVVDGDAIMAICARDLKRKGTLAKNTVVATVMSNLGLERSLREEEIQLVRTGVGDRYVVESMRSNGYTFGGEQSGHLVFMEHASTGDGCLAALMVLEIMVRSGKPLSELVQVFERVPQVLLNVAVTNKPPLNELHAVRSKVEAVERELGNDGRVLLRYSGTEPKARVMVEGQDEDKTRYYAQEIAQVIATEIGA